MEREEQVHEKDDFLKFNVVQWFDDEEGEYEAVIDIMLAVSEYHASALLRDRMRHKGYPKGAWLEYFLVATLPEALRKGV